MSKVIPKELLTAYQRWELAAFDDNDSHTPTPSRRTPEPKVNTVKAAPPPPPPPPPPKPEPVEPEVVLPTAEEIENLQQQAWQEGFQLGMEEGKKAGLEVSKEAAKPLFNDLTALALSLEGAQLLKDEEIAHEVLTLSLIMAQQILRKALKIKPDLVLEAIREALKTLPALNGQYTLISHPESAATIREWLAQEQGHLTWRVVEDSQMERGDFRFESTYSELDGSVRKRWQELTNSLDVDMAWLQQ
jgi:flagellar assembly protein FliH